jgi:hypothetical protein
MSLRHAWSTFETGAAVCLDIDPPLTPFDDEEESNDARPDDEVEDGEEEGDEARGNDNGGGGGAVRLCIVCKPHTSKNS